MSEGQQSETIKLASIVSIDVSGFSSLSERDQRRAARQIEALRARIEQVASAQGGRIFNTAGDGFMLEFAAAGAALAAIQDLLDKRPKGEPPIRVGAHVGDVIVTITNDLLGHGVNVAARLQSLAEPGSALVSGEFRSMARNSPQAAFLAKGRQPLENIDERVQTFEILSRRRRTARVWQRVGFGALAAAVIAVGAAGYFLAPTAIAMARAHGFLGGAPVEQTVQAAPATAAQLASVLAAPEGPRWTPGQTFRDCESCPEMVVVPGGGFLMGAAASEPGSFATERPQHQVAVPMFAASTHEITFQEWDSCLGSGGCGGFSPPDRSFGRGRKPVLGVSWDDAQAYVRWLNERTDSAQYRLLTEAEWEYAARAGATTAYATGARLSRAQAVYGGRAPLDVGSRPANAFGLFDMHGNVWEWVEDCYAASYASAPVDGSAVAPARCAARVYRGGGFADQATNLRAANRRRAAPGVRVGEIGFRIAKTLN